ncbi:radical SAM protein [Clostridium botulinum]|nr:radical SAM protein [Clostridium botulinum]MBO0576316.1 radical SAM protein [Clostridium botulinum]
MKDILLNLKSPFLTFQLEDKYFLYDGDKGFLMEISHIIYDILNCLHQYDFNQDSSCKAFMQELTEKYNEKEVGEALHNLKYFSKRGFLKDKGTIYKFYKKEYKVEENKSFKGGLWLNISHDCNLKCSYCYGNGGDYGEVRALMTKEVAKKCIDYWFKKINKNQKFFNVAFFGGEPLINQPVLFFAVEYINNLMNSINAEARYTITTNGTIMNNKIIKLLKDNKFEFMLSIDGLEEIHNRNRPYASGEDSFKSILANIEILKKNFDNLMANMVVTKKSIPFLKKSVEKLWSIGINYVNISLCCDKNEKYEYEDFEIWHKQIHELSEITYNNIINGKKYGVLNLIESMENINNRKVEVTCSLFINGVFVFSSVGNIYRCYRYVGDEKYKIGNIDDKNINLLNYKSKKAKIEKCSNCWAQILCKDGCAYEHELLQEILILLMKIGVIKLR